MEVVRLADAAAFLELAGPLLEADEARNNLILGVAATTVAQPNVYPSYRGWVVIAGGTPVVAASRTPPYPLIVADPLDADGLAPLLDAVRQDDPELPGLVANTPWAEGAAAMWVDRTRSEIVLRFAEGVFALTEVADVARSPGSARQATAADRDLAVAWVSAFSHEAVRHRPETLEQIVRSVDARLGDEHAGLWFWEPTDGDPVSLAGFGGRTPTGIRIGPVYTPPAYRRRGYATTLVADLSRAMLTRGHRACFLYTDLANPTSNAIYERIGYRRVADAFEIRFGEPSS
jgi:GNAT superfamily N-acetyltransferase